MHKVWRLIVIMLLASFAVTAAAQEQGPTVAAAELKDTSGRVVGNVLLTAVGNGAVRVQVWAGGLAPGLHGIHIHAVGACTPDFGAAGAHFNPDKTQHGAHNPNGPHGGDLPNLVIGADGNGALDMINPRIGLGSTLRSLFDADGSSVIVHANTDDEMTDPIGNSGGRIACGVIGAVQRPAGLATAAAGLKDTSGRVVGNVLFTAVGNGTVRVQVWAGGLAPGLHGIHIHTVGACTPDFGAAGAHFNPDKTQHGAHNPNGPHGGDLPNLVIGADGNGALDVINPRIGLGSTLRSLFDTDGSSVIVHANTDDEMTDPIGNSGGRIACGVIGAVPWSP